MYKSIHSQQYGIFLKHLRAARRATKVTQADLARKINWIQADISKVENGVRRLDVIELRHWLAALGVDISHFMDDLEHALQASTPELLAKLHGTR